MHRFIALLTAPLFVVLLILWCTAAQAADMVCYRHTMAQGRVGESVLVCEPAPKAPGAARNVRKPGRTVVAHYGMRGVRG